MRRHFRRISGHRFKFAPSLRQIRLYGKQRGAGIPSMLGLGARRVRYSSVPRYYSMRPVLRQIKKYGAQKRAGYPSMLGLGGRRIYYT